MMRVTAKATGRNIGDGHYLPTNPVSSTKENNAHGICASYNDNWRARNNAKQIKVQHIKSDSFCL